MAPPHKRTKSPRRPAARSRRKREQSPLDAHLVVERIDVLIRELEMLRHQLAAARPTAQATGLTQALFGAAGRGARDEYDFYNPHFDRIPAIRRYTI